MFICVGLGYGYLISSLEDFLGSMGSLVSPETARYRASRLTVFRICLEDLSTHLPQDNHCLGRATLLRPPFANLVQRRSVAPEGVPLVPRIRDGRG